MGALSMLRVARRFPGLNKQSEFLHLETLIEREAGKIKDGYHHARWICPLSGIAVGLGVFVPLAIRVSPLFLIGTAGFVLLGASLGYIFHRLAVQISPAQMKLRQRCMQLGQRLVSLKNLLGSHPALSPKVAEALDEAAATFLVSRPDFDQGRRPALPSVWGDAASRAERALDEAMAQMLTLAEPETPQAQEAELNRGWAEPLLAEMQATAKALEQTSRSGSLAAQLDPANTPLANLRDARSDLERLDSAASELDRELRA